MDRKITIIGAGVAGMTAYIYLTYKGFRNVRLVGTNLGGEFLSGGFKYLPLTIHTYQFMQEAMGVEFGVRKINGAVCWPYMYGREIAIVREYPLTFLKNQRDGIELQIEYWNKTRGDSPVDPQCMNDPWAGRTELAIVPDVGVDGFFAAMSKLCRNGYEEMQVNQDNVGMLLDQSDVVVYTIPLDTIAVQYGIPVAQNHTTLTLLHLGLDRDMGKKLWWDYLYVPQHQYPFHRVSRRNDGSLDFEVNDRNWSNDGDVFSGVRDFAERVLKLRVPESSITFSGKIKGQLVSKNAIAFCEKVFLLGRYAQQDSRMTWDKVVERLFAKWIEHLMGMDV